MGKKWCCAFSLTHQHLQEQSPCVASRGLWAPPAQRQRTVLRAPAPAAVQLLHVKSPPLPWPWQKQLWSGQRLCGGLKPCSWARFSTRKWLLLVTRATFFSSLVVPVCQYCLLLLLRSLLCPHQWKRPWEGRVSPPEKGWAWSYGASKVVKSPLLPLQASQPEDVRLVHSPVQGQPLVKAQVSCSGQIHAAAGVDLFSCCSLSVQRQGPWKMEIEKKLKNSPLHQVLLKGSSELRLIPASPHSAQWALLATTQQSWQELEVKRQLCSGNIFLLRKQGFLSHLKARGIMCVFYARGDHIFNSQVYQRTDGFLIHFYRERSEFRIFSQCFPCWIFVFIIIFYF